MVKKGVFLFLLFESTEFFLFFLKDATAKLNNKEQIKVGGHRTFSEIIAKNLTICRNFSKNYFVIVAMVTQLFQIHFSITSEQWLSYRSNCIKRDEICINTQN